MGSRDVPQLGGTSPIDSWIGNMVMVLAGFVILGLFVLSAWQLRFWDAVFGVPPKKEKFDPFLLFGGSLFEAGFGAAGCLMRSTQQRLAAIARQAYEIVQGRVYMRLPGRGHVMVFYAFQSSRTNQELRGSTQVGNLESVNGQLVENAPVAILYASEELHTIL